MADTLTPVQRSYCMSCVKNKDTDLEVTLRSAIHKRGYRFRKHSKYLPGKPDIVFPKFLIAVFIDGDFWHGFRFPVWEQTLPEFWRKKISLNRKRDQKNFRKLRRMGWQVLRVWQHQIERDLDSCVAKIITALATSSQAVKKK